MKRPRLVTVKTSAADRGIAHCSCGGKPDIAVVPQMSYFRGSCLGFRNSWSDLLTKPLHLQPDSLDIYGCWQPLSDHLVPFAPPQFITFAVTNENTVKVHFLEGNPGCANFLECPWSIFVDRRSCQRSTYQNVQNEKALGRKKQLARWVANVHVVYLIGSKWSNYLFLITYKIYRIGNT